MPVVHKKTEMGLAGHSQAKILASIKMAFRGKELPDLEPGAMSYMMGGVSCPCHGFDSYGYAPGG